jgi:hypothetical protein
MKATCTLEQLPTGAWLARHESRDAGRVEAQAATREAALEKIKGEIRYRLELCPCTGETYQHIDIEVVASRAAR